MAVDAATRRRRSTMVWVEDIAAGVLTALLLASPAVAQKGTGASEGLGHGDTPVATVTLTGRVQALKTGRCELTTGRAMIGAHVMLATETRNRVNLHLGPEAAVADLLDTLTPGTTVTAEAVRTDALPADAFIARTVTVGGTTTTLRDSDLRPAWRLRPDGSGQGRRGGAMDMPHPRACPW
jgi:hypothetical protein